MQRKNQKRIAHTVLQELQDVGQVQAKYTSMEYSGNSLMKVEVFKDAAKTVRLFTKDLSYSAGKLIQTVVTRERDGATATKDFTYRRGKSHTPEAIEKNRIAHTGKVVSQETRDKLKAAGLAAWARRKAEMGGRQCRS